MGPIRGRSTRTTRASNNSGPPKKPNDDPPEKKPNKTWMNGSWRKMVKKNKKETENGEVDDSGDVSKQQETWPDLDGTPDQNQTVDAGLDSERRGATDLVPATPGGGIPTRSRPRAHTEPVTPTAPTPVRERGLSDVSRTDFSVMTPEALLLSVRRATDEMARRLGIVSPVDEPSGGAEAKVCTLELSLCPKRYWH